MRQIGWFARDAKAAALTSPVRRGVLAGHHGAEEYSWYQATIVTAMNMNWLHRRICSSPGWARFVEESLLPEVLGGVDLGPDVLEIGPGPGVTTRLLAGRVPRLTALEIDERLAERLRGQLGSAAAIVQGDAAAMTFPDATFSGAVCLTMLYHVRTPRLQDQLFAQTRRVLRPGGVFAGCAKADPGH